MIYVSEHVQNIFESFMFRFTPFEKKLFLEGELGN